MIMATGPIIGGILGKKSAQRRKNRPKSSTAILAPRPDPCGYDGEPPVFVQARDIPGAAAARTAPQSQINVNRSRVSMLRHRGVITDPQFAAAELLMTALERSQGVGRDSTQALNAVGGGGGAEIASQSMIDAGRSFERAKAAAGDCWGVVEFVVVKNQTVTQCAQAFGVRQATARAKTLISSRLCAGLDKIALVFGI